jgi:oligopeptide transport system permease protein
MSNQTDNPFAPGDAGHPSGGEMQTGVSAAVTAVAAGDLGIQATLWGDAWRQLRRNPFFVVPAFLITALVVIAVLPGLFARHDPRLCSLSDSLRGSSWSHPFGFDQQGCDQMALIFHGARVSLTIGIVVVGSFTIIGIVLGCLAGYYAGWVDTVIARIADIWFAIPTVLGAIVLLNLFQNRGLIQVSLVLVVFGWPTTLRLVRSSVLSVKEMDYVQAARALGGNDGRVLLRHILPNSLAPVIVYGTIAVGGIISAEAALSFLGVGLERPAISWGLMLNEAQDYVLDYPHLLIWPGLFLSVTVLSFILMGDALRDALDPKLR